jgi:hypothetical protein
MAKNTVWSTPVECMTTQERDDATDGDFSIIFNTDEGGYQGWNGSSWSDLSYKGSPIVTPSLFGAIEEDETTTAQLQEFFDYVRDNDVVGDFRGSWTVNDTIIIGGIDKEYVCGEIKADTEASSVSNFNTGTIGIVSVEGTRSIYNGHFVIEGQDSASFGSRSILRLITFVDTDRSNRFEFLDLRGCIEYGIYLRPENGNAILTEIEKLRITNCGSVGTGYLTGTYDMTVNAVVNAGSANSTGQTSTLTLDSAPDTNLIKEHEILEINGEAHYVNSVSGSDVEVYPWVDDTFTGDIYWLGGGVLVAGGNTAGTKIESIDAIRAGLIRFGGLYGTKAPYIQMQFCAGVGIGFDVASNNLGSEVGLYCENNTFDFVQITRVDTNTVIHNVATNFDKWFVIDAMSNASTRVKSQSNAIRAVVYSDSILHQKRDSEKPLQRSANSSSTKLGNSPIQNHTSYKRNTGSVNLKWDEKVNRLFGYDTCYINMYGTGSNGEPTGTTTFKIHSDNSGDGHTVMGGATYDVSGYTEPSRFVCYFDYANLNWIIKQF